PWYGVYAALGTEGISGHGELPDRSFCIRGIRIMATPDTPSIDLEHAFSIRFELGGHIDFSGAMRSRTFEPVVGGEIFGPKLQGRVVPQSGADYSSNGLMDTRLMLQSAEGIWIYMDQYGYELE